MNPHIPTRENLEEALVKTNELMSLLRGEFQGHKVLYIGAVAIRDTSLEDRHVFANDSVNMLLTTHKLAKEDHDLMVGLGKPPSYPGMWHRFGARLDAIREVMTGDSRLAELFCDLDIPEDRRVAHFNITWMSKQVRIVSAAHRIRREDGHIVIPCVRHMDELAHALSRRIYRTQQPIRDMKLSEQGFVDNYGNFLDRKQAHLIARLSGQIDPTSDLKRRVLYSEDLY